MTSTNRNFAEAFEENFMGDQDLFFGVVNIFEAQHREYLQNLLRAIQADDRANVKVWSHKIKGSISHFHHTAPVRSAQVIEELSQTAPQTVLMSHYKELESYVEALRTDVQNIMQEMQKNAA